MSKALVVIHFYYSDQVDLILDNLGNISLPYDLYCSISNVEEYEKIKNKVLKFDPDAHIVDVANVGYDVWPFVYVINNVDLSEYDYIIKLHTKRDLDVESPVELGNGYHMSAGGFWRDSLYAFIASKDNFDKCINALRNPKVGMCARFNVIHNAPNHCGVIDYAKLHHPDYILNLPDYSFVAGTMFIAKAALFQILKDMNIGEHLFEKPTKKHKTQFAHVIERTIGEIVYKSGMTIVDPFTPIEHIRKIKRLYRKRKWNKRFINYIAFPILIPKIRRKIKDKLFAKWCAPYLNSLMIADKDDRFLKSSMGVQVPKISVIIPVYNAEKYIAETLNSLRNQIFKEWEAICIDDGSTDNSIEILEQYAKKDPRIKIIEQKNTGVVTARNRAIAAAQSEYIYPLDSDDIITPDCLEKLYKAMQDGRGDIITSRVMMFGCQTGEFVLKEPTKRNMAQNNCLVNAALFRKADFEKSGGFDTKFNAGLEDYDFWLNLVFRHNKKIYRVPEILFYYRIKKKTESRNMQCLAQTDYLIKRMCDKYPLMRAYRRRERMRVTSAHVREWRRKWVRKIGRFLFRIQDGKIKIFKIPVWKVKEGAK